MTELIKSIDEILIHNKRNKLYLSLSDIAEATNNKVTSLRDLITKKATDFKSLGFDINKLPKMPNGQRDWSTVLLNETQATFLLSLMKNNEIVTKFKLGLAIKLDYLKEQINLAYEKEIKQLKRVERTTNVYSVNGVNYTSARGIVELDENIEFTAKEFKEELSRLGVIQKKMVVVPKWVVTKQGEELGIVKEDTHKGVIYNVEESTKLFKQSKAIDEE